MGGWLTAILNLLNMGGGSAAAVAVTPEETLTVPAFSRSLTVPAFSRTLTVPAFTTTLTCPDPE